MKTLTHILEEKPLDLMGGLNSPTYFLSLARLSIWNRAYLESSDHMTFSHYFGVPLRLASLISEYSRSRAFPPPPLSFCWVVRVESLFTPVVIMSSDVAGSHRLLPAETHLSLQLLSNGCCLFIYLLFFFFLSPKHVAETSEDIIFNKHVR